MKFPLPIAIPLCILVVVATWMFRAKAYNASLEPPTDQELADAKNSYANKEGPIQEVQPAHRPAILVKPKIKQEVVEQIEKPTVLEEMAFVQIAPALDEYRAAGNKGPDYLNLLASQLTEASYGERALLAYERILDSSVVDAIKQDAAISKIQSIRTYIPNWVVDPSESTELTLNIEVTKDKTKATEAAMKQITEVMNQASSGLLSISTKLHTKKTTTDEAAATLGIWLSHSKDLKKPAQVFSAKFDSENTNVSLKRITYSMLRHHFSNKTTFQPLPELQENADPQLLISCGITRLLWSELPKTLAVSEAPPAATTATTVKPKRPRRR